MSRDPLPLHPEALEDSVALLMEYGRLENFKYCLRWSRCTVVGIFTDMLKSMMRWLRTRSAFVYNVNLERYVSEYQRKIELCFEQRSSMRGVLEETFEVYECVFNIFDVVRTICAHVKRMVQHNRHKAPSSYWPSKHITLPRLDFHNLRR